MIWPKYLNCFVVHVLSLYGEVTNVLCVSLLSHDRYQYDSLILSKLIWAHPRQHLQQLLWCQGRWRGADVTKECFETNFHFSSTQLRKLCVHYAYGFDNVESVYFFYGKPVQRKKAYICCIFERTATVYKLLKRKAWW
jgi:hypothetical protein